MPPFFPQISQHTSASRSLHCYHILLGILFSIDLAFFFWSPSTAPSFKAFTNSPIFNHNLPSQCENTPYPPFLLYIPHSIYHDLTCHVIYLASDYLNVSLMGTGILLSYYSLLIPVTRTVSATNIYRKNELTRDIWSTKTYSNNIAGQI